MNFYVLFNRCFRFLCILHWVFGILALSSCQEDTIPSGHTNVCQFSLLQSMSSSNTRASSPGDEDYINRIDVLSFKVDPSDPTNIRKGTFFYHVRSNYNPATQIVDVELLQDGTAQTFVVLANLSPQQIKELGAIVGEPKEDVMQRLLLPVTSEGKPNLDNGKPMWGELGNQTVNDSYSGTKNVTLIHSLAKFTLECSTVTQKHFFDAFESLLVYNPRTKGHVSPDNFNTASLTVSTPTVPVGATPPSGTSYILIPDNAPVSDQIVAGSNKSFYLFEADSKNRAAASALDATCLVVKVKFAAGSPEGQALADDFGVAGGYYRIDFKDNSSGSYLDLLRGHEYRIVVESVEGAPAPTPQEAYNGNHTLKCTIEPWSVVNENIINIIERRLIVDKREILIPLPERGKPFPLTITTENTDGWQISDVPSFLQISDLGVSGDQAKTITVTGIKGGRGSFKITAGAATMDIKVKVEKLPIEFVSEYNLAGGSGYGYVPSSGSTPAQSDPQLRWAINHNYDQSGYYNWYVCTGTYDATNNPTGKNIFMDPFFISGAGKGYHLPSYWEWCGVFGYDSATFGSSINISDVNEAIEFGAVKRTFASDYFSTGNSVCYALRFKKATGKPNDNSSLTDFPLASDNNMLCAFRYTWGKVATYTYALQVDCIFLGADFSGNISTISNEAWWALHSAEIVTRTLPSLSVMLPPSSSGGSFSGSHYWSRTQSLLGSNNAYHLAFAYNYCRILTGGMDWGYTVRTFADD